MDLFGDLPPPSKATDSTPSLFDDLPPESESTNSTSLGKHKSQDGDRETDPEGIKKPKLSVNHYKLKAYIGERRGEREDMQDAHTIIDDFTPLFSALPNNISRVAYYGVYDGHAGPKASKFAAEHLHINIKDRLPKGDVQNLDREVKKCLIDSFKKTDEAFLQKASAASPSWKHHQLIPSSRHFFDDGTTVAAILVLDDTVYSGNLGDSKAVLCRRSTTEKGKLSFVHLTKDHNPSNFEERKRIEKSGGQVREGRVMGTLEVSRSIGDGRFKHCGIISTPDVFRCQLTGNDLFILIACDGLWKAFTVEEAAKFALNVIEDDSIQLPNDEDVQVTNFESGKPTSLRDVRCEEACNRLAVEAVKRGCTDNVTVMIVDVIHPAAVGGASEETVVEESS